MIITDNILLYSLQNTAMPEEYAFDGLDFEKCSCYNNAACQRTCNQIRLLKWDKTNQDFIPLFLRGGVKLEKPYPAFFMEVSV